MARTPRGVSAMAAMVSGRRSLGWGLVNRTRRMPSTAPDRPQQLGEQRAGGWVQVAAVGVDVLPEQGDLGDAVGRRAASTSATMSSRGRLTSWPRTDGTMQKAQRVVAADLDGDPRRVGQVAHGAGSADGEGPRPRAPVPSRISMTGPSVAARSQQAGRAGPGCGCRTPRRRAAPVSWMRSRSFWARQPPTAICMSGRWPRSDLRWPRWP